MTVITEGKPHRFQTGNFTTRQNVFAIQEGKGLIIPHWQLRDLVQSSPLRPHSVFYINNQTLREVDLATGKFTRAMSPFDFVPRCIGICDDLVVVGSENGHIQAQSLNKPKEESMKTQLSSHINNNICIYTGADGTRRALVGNNDHSVKIWNLDKWRSDGSIKLPVAINHCSVSPDKTSMVCVGDSSEVFLFDISSSGSFHHQATLLASDDWSFSTSFSSTSSMFAVASQDGIISVWDRRFTRTETPIKSSGRLKTLKTTRVGNASGAARLVRFSPAPLDLLMFTEQKEYVHLVDARAFEKTQIVSIGEGDNGQQGPDIGGACFAQDGKSILIGSEKAIWQWEIDTRGRKLFPSIELF